jgi:hypothetical protein
MSPAPTNTSSGATSGSFSGTTAADAPPAAAFESSGVGDDGLTGEFPPHPVVRAENTRWAETRPIAKNFDLNGTPKNYNSVHLSAKL